MVEVEIGIFPLLEYYLFNIHDKVKALNFPLGYSTSTKLFNFNSPFHIFIPTNLNTYTTQLTMGNKKGTQIKFRTRFPL